MDIGPLSAKEIVLECKNDQSVFRSEALRNLVPYRCTFGFDVIVEVGTALFIDCRNNEEIIKTLAAKNIEISASEISYLGRKYIVYLALAHRENQSQLRKLIVRKGGYVLHADGTCENDSPNLFCALDGISELILDSIKIPSEKKESLVPFFRRIRENYGLPVALVHDMSRAIIAAIEEVFPTVADFICHFHFLRDIGKDLLKEKYTALQKRLRTFNVRSKLRKKAKYIENKIDMDSNTIEIIKDGIEFGKSEITSLQHTPLLLAYIMIQWIFKSPDQSGGYGFPFDRPHLDFFRRLQKMHHELGNLIKKKNREEENKPLKQIYQLLNDTVKDKELNGLAEDLEKDSKVFDKLRNAMRIALPEEKNGLNDDGEDADMKTIKENVTEFRKELPDDNRFTKMAVQIDKYWEKLFADPVEVVTPNGEKISIQPQRTNNILERFFRGMKQRARKKSGTKSLNKVLKAILAETPFVQNLKNQKYYEIILNGCKNLAERFSQIDAHLVHEEMAAIQRCKGEKFPELKKLIESSDLPKKISSLFH